jgi:GNAT superfamily N-acetyltransferase
VSAPGARAGGPGAAPREWTRGEFTISTDPARLDLDVIHGFLARSYWAEGIPRETVARSIEHSIPFGLFHGAAQVGFARWVTDHATFAYLGDVFVLEEYRGRGLSKWMMEVAAAHPDVQGQRRWCLLTRDAHGLYRGMGFHELESPERWMERRFPNPYPR